jgi:cyclopropane fatty-acyl-phospholipid synthase-like methyltransferase
MALESRTKAYAEALGEKRARLRAIRDEIARKEKEEKVRH